MTDRERLFQLVAEEACRDGIIEPDENRILNTLARFLRLPAETAMAAVKENLARHAAGELGEARALDPTSLYREAVTLVGEDPGAEKMLAGLRQVLGLGDPLAATLAAVTVPPPPPPGSEYAGFDPQNPSHQKLLADLRTLDPNVGIEIAPFHAFEAALQAGIRDLTYMSEKRTDGTFYWVTDVHAAQIGRALNPDMLGFGLDFTTFEGDGLSIMAAAAPEGASAGNLVLSHRSGDECTHTEARGAARLATRLGSRTLSLFSLEFDPGALDVLAEELKRLGNRNLELFNIRNLETPDQVIHHPSLEEIAAANKGG